MPLLSDPSLPDIFLHQLKSAPATYWLERGQRRMLRLFQAMAARVPAYKDFLRQQSISPASIRTWNDFTKLPPTSKENYLQRYPLPELCWDGVLADRPHMIASTSGSTGEPFYFPRSQAQDDQFALTAELLFREYWQIHRRRTLFINCFALGVWIGGMYMYQALKYIADKRPYKLSIITPGAYKEEALKAIRRLGKQYDQVIIGGYPPLVKDLIDEGAREGLCWSEYPIRFFFAAEGFSETFRDYINRQCGITDEWTGSFNHYGTADMGTMAHETPATILLRRLARRHEPLYQSLFGAPSQFPTLAQFIPEFYYFEDIAGELWCSSASGLPLIRYDLKDRGGIHTLGQVQSACQAEGVDLGAEFMQAGLQSSLWNLPFVHVYERKDLTVSIYSVNIYPESIRRALEHPSLESALTTKFTMRAPYDDKQNQFLEINVELKFGITPAPPLEEQIHQSVLKTLHEENSEWRDFYADPGIRHKVVPRLVLWQYQHPEHFKPGGKQKWTKKT